MSDGKEVIEFEEDWKLELRWKMKKNM